MSSQPYDIPHLAFPIRAVNGVYVCDRQDTNDEVTTCVRNICAFEKSTRIERPDFGINDPTLKRMPIDVTGIGRAISDWEPRASAELETIIDLEGQETLNIRVAISDSEAL